MLLPGAAKYLGTLHLSVLWCGLKSKQATITYEWWVLPHAVPAVQCMLSRNMSRITEIWNEDVVETVLESFYVDNFLKSLPCPNELKNSLK